MSDAGFSLSRQQPAASATTVSLSEGVTPGEVARTLARAPAIQDTTIDAARDALDGRNWSGVHDFVEEHDLELGDIGDDVGSLLVRLGRGDARAAWQLLAALARAGEGRRPLDDWDTLPRLLALSDAVTPTVAVHIKRGFVEDVKRDQRETIAEQLAALSRGADVRVVGTGLTLRRFAREHRHELPASVRDGLDTRPSEATVLDAREALAPDGPYTSTLRALREQPSETATYAALADAVDVPGETLRSRLSRLRGLNLVSEGYDTGDGTAVDLRPAGAAYLDAVAETVGEQIGLNDCVSGVSNPSDDAVYPANTHGRGEDGDAATADGDRHRLPNRHDVAYLSRREAVPPAATAPENGVGVVNYPVEPREDRAQTGWSYDEAADTLVVSAEWDNPLQYTVCLARAFTDGRVWRHVLDEDRLAEADLDARLNGHRSLLRGCRCLGYLPDEIDDGVAYAGRLQEARDDLLAMTGDLGRDDYDMETDEFRSLITREALGLAGTAAHLLDLAGVDVVREVRLPSYSRNFNRGSADGRIDRDDLTENLATIAAIQSTYGEHTGYRQLLEDRPDKVTQSPEAEVDAADPYGSLIGSFVVVGDLGGRAEDLADAIRRQFAGLDVRDDAPEFAIDVPVTTDGGRSWTALTMRRMLRAKNLNTTREAVGLLDAFARTPYDVAGALAALGSEDAPRDVRQAEVRFTLAHLDAERLLTRETPPAARRIVAALLNADRPLSRADLVDRGDVSRSSTYTHLPHLEALGLVEATPERYRLALAFHTDDERHDDHLPGWMTERHTATRDVLYGAALDLVDDAARAGDPDDPVFGPYLRPPDEALTAATALASTWPWVDDWGLPTVAALLGEAPPGLDDPTPLAQFGADLEQAPLSATSQPPAAPSNP